MDTEEEIITRSTAIVKESIKLNHNSRGYTWELRLHVDDKDVDACIKRLKKLDEDLERTFGGGISEI